MTDFEKELLTLQIIMAKDAEERFDKIIDIAGGECTTRVSDEYLTTTTMIIKHRLINVIHDYNNSHPIDRALSTDDIDKFLEKFIIPLIANSDHAEVIRLIDKAESYPRYIKDISDMADVSLGNKE